MGVRGRRGARSRRAPLAGAGAPALAAAVSLAAGAASTWPALRDARTDFLAAGLPARAGAAAAGDHLQTVWQLWLPWHQFERLAPPWLDPYSFRPEAEPQPNFAAWPFGALFGPLEAAAGAVVAWNVFVLLGYVGAGVFAFLWLRSCGLGTGAALVGAIAFALAPYRVAQAAAGHLVAWIALLLPFALWAWERRWYWVAAGAVVSIPLSGELELAVAAVPFFVLYALLRGGSRSGVGGAAAGAAAAWLLVWISSVRGSIAESPLARLDENAADLPDFLSRDPRHGLETFVLIGWVTPLIAAVGFALRRRTRLALLLAGGVLVPCVFALGADSRPMLVACLALAGLAALATEQFAARHAGAAVAAVVVALVALDLRVGVSTYRATPADEGNRAYAAIEHAPLGRVLELPVHAPDARHASVYLYYAMQAPRERPAGYSNAAPKEAATTLRRLRPCTDVRDLAELGVRILAVHGPTRCGVPGRLIARDGAVSVYEAYVPPTW